MKFHFDTCISVRLARAIRVLEDRPNAPITISIHDEVFAANALDVDWLPELTAQGVNVLITADSRIYASPDERAAWTNAGVLTYFVSKTFCNEAEWPKVHEMITWWPTIKLHAKIAPPATAWRLPWKGKTPEKMGADGREQPVVTAKRARR